ncbi:hypothetical protein ES703_46319 [subsurface metagenome]
MPKMGEVTIGDIEALIAIHAAIAAAHHARYTDLEAAAIAAALIADHADLATVHQDAPNLIANHKAIAAAHHAKTTLFTELTDRAGKDKLNWALNKLLLGAGPDADPTEIDVPVGGYTEGARVTHSVDQDIPNATTTTLAFDEERYDTDAIHDNTVFNSRLTCKTAGKYLIIGSIVWEGSAIGSRYIHIRLNGVTIIAYHLWGVSNDLGHRPFIATIYDLAVTDYVELRVRQQSGVALNVFRSGESSPLFMMQRIG